MEIIIKQKRRKGDKITKEIKSGKRIIQQKIKSKRHEHYSRREEDNNTIEKKSRYTTGR